MRSPHPLTTLLLGLVLLTAAACKNRPTPQPPAAASDPNRDYLIQAILWQQHAAEYRALCHQAYNIAREKADHILQVSRFAKPPCVVLDIDETVLDNSPYAAWQILNDQPYSPTTWKDWTAQAIADTVPGALAFLRWADTRGLEVFYVSNRRAEELDATVKNLTHFGFPDADAAHVLLRTDVATKEPRRLKVEQTNSIIMLFGDNLADFSDVFENKTNPQRDAETDQRHSIWGNQWIVLPNPGYGSWENAMQGYQRDLSDTQLDSIRRANLQSYK